MNVQRPLSRHRTLTTSERRALRRIEDATAADDPLLEARLGLALNPFARGLVRLRRRTKAMGRRLATAPSLLAVLPALIATTVVFLVDPGVTPALLVVAAFVLGAASQRSFCDRAHRRIRSRRAKGDRHG